MHKHFKLKCKIIFAIEIGFVAFVPHSSAQQTPRPDELRAQDGPGLNFLPVQRDGSSALGLKLEGCSAHLVEYSRPDREILFPCGQWFVPAPGRYLSWVEYPGRISEDNAVLIVGQLSSTGRGMRAEMPVVDAGSVSLKTDSPWPKAGTLRLLSLEGDNTAFERRVSDRIVAEGGVQIPSGRAIAGLFDSSDNAVALTHPFEVLHGKTVAVAPASEANEGSVLVIAERPASLRGAQVTFRLVLGEANLEPNVFKTTKGRLFAVWYDVPAGAASLRVLPASIVPSVIALQRRAGEVSTVRLELRPK